MDRADGPVTPARFCRGLPASRRRERDDGRLSPAELALQPTYELVCGWFGARDYAAERFRAILEERVLGARDNRVAVACSGILGAWMDPRRRRVLAAFADGPGPEPARLTPLCGRGDNAGAAITETLWSPIE